MSESMTRVEATMYRDGAARGFEHPVCLEEPLEIMVDDEPYYMTMRTPGEDIFLALGLCLTEGAIASFDDVLSVSHCEDSVNRVNLYLPPGRRAASKASRQRGVAYASCGLCGKELISDICTDLEKRAMTLRLALSAIFKMQKVVESRQPIFQATGCAHAAGLFDEEGRMLACSEDVGRHNALDKTIGRVLFERKSEQAKTAILTSRLSYEMVLKSARLGIELIAATSAPTSLAIELARRLDMTLIAFLRPEAANIYTAPERIIVD